MFLDFQKFTLSNGINLVTYENHHAQSVVVRGYLPGGANLDPPELAGLANFSTHLMRRGTARRSFAEINEIVEAVAASVYISSSRHWISFGGKSLAEDFELLVSLLAEILLTPSFPPVEIEKVRGQIFTGLKEAEDNPRSMTLRYFRELLYTTAHPYGRPAGGTLESIPRISRESLLDFYRQTLPPREGTLVVVGDVNSLEVYQILESYLGTWQPEHSPPDTTLPPPPVLTAPVRYTHPMENKSQVDLVLGNIGPTRLAGDYYAAEVADIILGQLGLGGRIAQTVRDHHGLAYYARSSLGGNMGPSPWLIYAGVNPEAVDKAVSIILAELDHLCQDMVTDRELADAKAYLIGVLPLQMEANEGIASILLEIHLYQLGDDFISRYADVINAVSKEEVRAAARKYLDPAAYALAIAGPYTSAYQKSL